MSIVREESRTVFSKLDVTGNHEIHYSGDTTWYSATYCFVLLEMMLLSQSFSSMGSVSTVRLFNVRLHYVVEM